MTEVRYQVFVSSTFTNLIEARSKVQRVLMQMNCIPAGMELFPAADEEQFAFIKKVIDDCDYYIVLIAGRYGSTTKEGVSYTESEFDYAVSKGIQVLAFLHADPDSIPVGQSELDAGAREKLRAFRAKVQTGRLVRMWRTPDELATEVILSLAATIKTHPGHGWMRGSKGNDPAELLKQINELRQRNDALQARLSQLKSPTVVSNLAKVSELFKLSVRDIESHYWAVDVSWDEMFNLISPTLLGPVDDDVVNTQLARAVLLSRGRAGRKEKRQLGEVRIDAEVFKTVRTQFMALGLVDIHSHVPGTLFWRLTSAGKSYLLQARSVKTTLGATDEER